ncbi:hypothetical protein BJ546DRAFT_636587 [Cryomyces antarcticus]
MMHRVIASRTTYRRGCNHVQQAFSTKTDTFPAAPGDRSWVGRMGDLYQISSCSPASILHTLLVFSLLSIACLCCDSHKLTNWLHPIYSLFATSLYLAKFTVSSCCIVSRLPNLMGCVCDGAFHFRLAKQYQAERNHCRHSCSTDCKARAL